MESSTNGWIRQVRSLWRDGVEDPQVGRQLLQSDQLDQVESGTPKGTAIYVPMIFTRHYTRIKIARLKKTIHGSLKHWWLILGIKFNTV